MKKINLLKERNDILNITKSFVIKHGWNENIIDFVVSDSKYTRHQIAVLFPDGYKSVLKFYLNKINAQMVHDSNKLNLKKMRTYEKIREIILLRLEKNYKDIELVKKTFFKLIIPSNIKLALSSISKTVDEIWFIAGDKSIDFNFYTKRSILAGVYLSVILYWINNEGNSERTKKFIDKQLKITSKISVVKSRLESIKEIILKFILFGKSLSKLMQ